MADVEDAHAGAHRQMFGHDAAARRVFDRHVPPPNSTIFAPSCRWMALSAVFLSVWLSAIEDKATSLSEFWLTGTESSTEAWGTFKVNIRVLQGQCGLAASGLTRLWH